VRFRVCTISHDTVDEDSDDGIFFNLKSIQTNLPKSRTQKEEKQKGVKGDQNPLKKSKKKNLKEVHSSNHILNIKIEGETIFQRPNPKVDKSHTNFENLRGTRKIDICEGKKTYSSESYYFL
jgi:hypothetical protein